MCNIISYVNNSKNSNMVFTTVEKYNKISKCLFKLVGGGSSFEMIWTNGEFSKEEKEKLQYDVAMIMFG